MAVKSEYNFEMNETLKTMAAHSSKRKYKKQAIDDKLLYEIINAARQAPTSSNLQAYSIIVVRDQAKKKALAKLCGDQPWIESCPVFLAMCPDLRRLEKVAARQDYSFLDQYIELFIVATVDTALVAQNILTGAESLGLGGVMIGGVRNNPAEVARLLELPDRVFPLMGMCLGWPDLGRPDHSPMIKPRLQPEVIIHRERYNEDRLNEYLGEYDKIIKATGLYDGPRRKVPSPIGKEIPDDEYSWCEHTARRLATTAPGVLRSHLRQFLLDRKIGLG